ncbi:cryptochrome/photolyase family protein [Methylosinus sporium]|uniref:Deoxyribodipyrimidine photo-lyase n=1 Tax=Methylosinus sporium TaxID=428 RepID=A0A2U1SVQ4_METSR|nr:deoxyribodipyrimidine photo-lyase [Methylosinus sporium]PWB95704.1 deoxyribodipyrimidine photolyase [Methylosinus sporium]
MSAPAIVWFRRDLRLADNCALTAAVASGAPLIPAFILDEEEGGEWRLGGASRWWLRESLAALSRDLEKRGAPLTLRRGDAQAELLRLVAETGAAAVYRNRIYEPWATMRDARIEAQLREKGVTAQSFPGALLAEPGSVCNAQGKPFRVFTPFWRALAKLLQPAPPLPAPKKLRAAPAPASDRLDDWRLQPKKPDWAQGLRESWRPGEAGAQRRLADFLRDGIGAYALLRDFPAKDGASRLSPHLHWGEISPLQIWSATAAAPEAGRSAFLRELGWREFCHHLLAAHPDMPEAPLDKSFTRFPWANDAAALAAWRKGETGYPLVDAAMRQLWRMGFMHNRLRMVAASFLVKHLLLPWREGELWFWDTLVDADLANNSGNWQWVAGCGADAAPYFRIFNPVLQGEKFDPDGAFVRRFVPELAQLGAKYIHKPWAAPERILREAGVTLGETYPRPIVDHADARRRALEAFATLRSR